MTTSDEDFTALLPVLLGIYLKEPGFRYRDGHHRVGHVAHGWFMRVQRGAEAVTKLSEAGYGAEAAPIRRSITEHVVALQWLANEGAAVKNILLRGAARDAEKRKAAVIAAGWTNVDEELFDAIVDDAKDLDRSGDYLLHFRNRCDRAGEPADYAGWLVETSLSHPCWESALPYIDHDPKTDTVSLARVPGRTITDVSFCVLAVYRALSAINLITRGKPLNKRLARLGPRIREAVIKQREEEGLPI